MDFQGLISAINGVGTLIIGAAVAVLGYRQFKSDQTFKDFQRASLEQNLRIKLLSERSEVIQNFREVYGEFVREARLAPETLQRMVQLSQRGQLLFHSELSAQIGTLTDLLLNHQYVYARVNKLLDHDPRGEYQKKVEEQIEIETKIWDSLKPILDGMIREAKVRLD